MTKSEIRKKLLIERNALSDEYRLYSDKIIFEKLISSDFYFKSDLILVYVSVGSEIDTKSIIDFSLRSGKKVAVPFCQKNRMDFYEIHSTDELTVFQFGIPTVDTTYRNKVDLTNNTLCIVPALCIDNSGNRLGYGGGYYDRFLSENNVNHVCIVRKDFVIDSLPAESFDYNISEIITD